MSQVPNSGPSGFSSPSVLGCWKLSPWSSFHLVQILPDSRQPQDFHNLSIHLLQTSFGHDTQLLITDDLGQTNADPCPTFGGVPEALRCVPLPFPFPAAQVKCLSTTLVSLWCSHSIPGHQCRHIPPSQLPTLTQSNLERVL